MQNYMAYFKSILLIAVFVLTTQLHAQSLKEALYSGRLKTDTGMVLKKGDTLTMMTNEEAAVQKAKADSVRAKEKEKESLVIRPVAIGNGDSVRLVVDSVETTAITAGGTEVPASYPVPKTPAENAGVWKKFVSDYTEVIKKEVLPSNRIKAGPYSVLIEYEIGEDGTVITNKIESSPRNSYLEDEIKRRMMINAPQLAPEVTSAGKYRRSVKKQMLTLIKDKD